MNGNDLLNIAGAATEAWAPDSWQNFPAAQQATYPDVAALQGTLEELAQLPPLVTSWEILTLRQQLAEAQRGERFLLQGGDCAETNTGNLEVLDTKGYHLF